MTTKRPRSDLQRARAVRNLRQAKQFLGLSWRGMAELIQKPNGKGHYSHGQLNNWSTGYRIMGSEQIRRVGELIANKLSLRYGREIGIELTHHSPWRIRPMVWCAHCRKWHELKRGDWKCKR